MNCLNCGISIHASYVTRYDGHCLQCWNAGIPRLTATIAAYKSAVKVLFDWYDRDGSVGGASVAFEDAQNILKEVNTDPAK